MATNISKSIAMKRSTMICDSVVIDKIGANYNNRNRDGHIIVSDDLNALKCFNDTNGVNVSQIPSVTAMEVAKVQVTNTNDTVCKSWYSRCKWRSQSCDRKQKYCPRPRYSWINGNHNSVA